LTTDTYRLVTETLQMPSESANPCVDRHQPDPGPWPPKPPGAL